MGTVAKPLAKRDCSIPPKNTLILVMLKIFVDQFISFKGPKPGYLVVEAISL